MSLYSPFLYLCLPFNAEVLVDIVDTLIRGAVELSLKQDRRAVGQPGQPDKSNLLLVNLPSFQPCGQAKHPTFFPVERKYGLLPRGP